MESYSEEDEHVSCEEKNPAFASAFAVMEKVLEDVCMVLTYKPPVNLSRLIDSGSVSNLVAEENIFKLTNWD